MRAPVPPAGLARKTCHASPHQTVRLFVSRLPSRPGSLTTSPEPPSWSPAHETGLPTASTSPARPTATTTSRRADEPAHDRPPMRPDEAGDGDEQDECDRGSRADDEQHAEDAAVRDTVGAGAAVLDECRPREGPGRDRHGRDGREQAEQRRLDPRLRECERERDDGDPGENPGARLGQKDHRGRQEEEQRPGGAAEPVPERDDEPEPEPERGIREQRERVPVADRALQAGDPARVVGPERGHRLPERAPTRRRTPSSAAEEERERRAAGRPGTTAAARPTTPKARTTSPFASASQERSGAIDHQIVRPPHATRPTAVAAATRPARSRRGSATAPKPHATTTAAAATTAAMPSGAVASVPEAPPSKSAQARSDRDGDRNGRHARAHPA